MKAKKLIKIVPVTMALVSLAQTGEVKADSTADVISYEADGAGFVATASSYTGMKKIDGVWYYLVDGEVATSYTGLVKYSSKWVYVYKGQLNTTYTGLVKYN